MTDRIIETPEGSVAEHVKAYTVGDVYSDGVNYFYVPYDTGRIHLLDTDVDVDKLKKNPPSPEDFVY